jgi:NAD(P)-dependent dehydrogenase (short-subunit alcohol dehydrogenase family)
MSKQLEGRIALITGANRGIGLAIAEEYAREGGAANIKTE